MSPAIAVGLLALGALIGAVLTVAAIVRIAPERDYLRERGGR